MSVAPRKVHKKREAITELPLYFYGHLLKKSSKEQGFKQFYAELRGSTLFLYQDETQHTYIKRMDLETLKTKDLDHPYQNRTLCLSMPKEQVQIKTESVDSIMKWRWYILTVINKELPCTLNMMPGQKVQLEDVLAQEKERTKRPDPPPRPIFLNSKSKKDEPDHAAIEMPDCFFDISREEAEMMLRDHPENGSIILRPSAQAHNYALTLRQQSPSGGSMKNFRVTSTSAGFVIELEPPVKVSSMNEVLKYFLEKTEYRLHPYRASQPYDLRFEAAPTPHMDTPSASKPKAQVTPMQRPETKVDPPPAPVPQEREYLIPDDGKPAKSKQKPTNLEDELREALKLRRTKVHSDEEDETCQNKGASKSVSRKVTWGENSSFA